MTDDRNTNSNENNFLGMFQGLLQTLENIHETGDNKGIDRNQSTKYPTETQSALDGSRSSSHDAANRAIVDELTYFSYVNI